MLTRAWIARRCAGERRSSFRKLIDEVSESEPEPETETETEPEPEP